LLACAETGAPATAAGKLYQPVIAAMRRLHQRGCGTRGAHVGCSVAAM